MKPITHQPISPVVRAAARASRLSGILASACLTLSILSSGAAAKDSASYSTSAFFTTTIAGVLDENRTLLPRIPAGLDISLTTIGFKITKEEGSASAGADASPPALDLTTFSDPAATDEELRKAAKEWDSIHEETRPLDQREPVTISATGSGQAFGDSYGMGRSFAVAVSFIKITNTTPNPYSVILKSTYETFITYQASGPRAYATALAGIVIADDGSGAYAGNYLYRYGPIPDGPRSGSDHRTDTWMRTLLANAHIQDSPNVPVTHLTVAYGTGLAIVSPEPLPIALLFAVGVPFGAAVVVRRRRKA